MKISAGGLSVAAVLSFLGVLCVDLCCGQRVGRNSSAQIVWSYVEKMAPQTFREPSGYLRYKYLVPSGPYDQLWDWDSVFMGVAMMRDFGSAPYLAGSMMNFLDHTDNDTGEVAGCLTPDGSSPTLYHAKPIIIQGAYLVARKMNDFSQFLPFQSKMEALLNYWDRTRKHADTGLYVWYDQLETGADNLPTSECPSSYSTDCWVEDASGMSLASADIMMFIYREHVAYSLFQEHWGQATTSDEKLQSIKISLDRYLWDSSLGYYIAHNTTTNKPITNRVFLMGIPLFAELANLTQASLVRAQLFTGDMETSFGFRSTSSLDSRYSNENMITPYSNWRGPIWVNANAMLIYGLDTYGYHSNAMSVAEQVVDLLAKDLVTTGSWHECYDSETGEGLAAAGFLSWNTLGANLVQNVVYRINPFSLV
ncbi:glycogen debranching enzyme [Pelomyxa schiedti]|nr:glycogen debranching enzyme [Pelomyxa schiedti]